MKEALISIIVPVYNVERYLPRCLDSILKQTYTNIEIVVVDDKSQDESGEIADTYERRYSSIVKSLHSPINEGVTSARLRGVAEAHGEWIGFVDGDDEIEEDMYERLINNAVKYHADISHCGYQSIVNSERIHYFYNTGRLVLQDRKMGIKDLLTGTYVEPGLWNKLFHRNLFHNLIDGEEMDLSIKYNEDLLMNYILFCNAQQSVYEDFCAYHYMARSDSAIRSPFNRNKAYDPIKVWRWIIDHSEVEIEKEAEYGYLNACINAYTTVCQQRDMVTEAKEMRHLIGEQKANWILLSRNMRIKAEMIQRMPVLYRYIMKIYTNYFQKKIYE